MLREELMTLVQQTRTTEIYTVTGIAAFYAWLVTNSTDVPVAAWFIPAPLTFIAGIRCLELYRCTRDIAAYLLKLEEQFFTEHSVLPGWERYLVKRRRIQLAPTAVVLWLCLLGGTLCAPFVLAKKTVNELPQRNKTVTLPPDTVQILVTLRSATNHSDSGSVTNLYLARP